VHPRVRKLLRLVAARPVDDESSLDALATEVGLSPSRLMHVFTESLGIPLRPYLAWLKLQRAAQAIVTGRPLADAAYAAGFADAAHMTRTFRKMFGVTPSSVRPPRAMHGESHR
jgi:AraC-like DNA-binding protein